MAITYSIETPFDTTPTSASTYEIFNVTDTWLTGNAVDAVKKYDAAFITNLGGNAPRGNLFIVYKDCLWVAGDENFPHRVWKSHIRNGEGWSHRTDWIDFYPDDGGKVNSLSVAGDELIVSKSNGRKYGYRIYDDGSPLNGRKRIIEEDRGDVSTRAGVTKDRVHYYMDRTGVNIIPREDHGRVSLIVQEVIDSIEPETLDDVASGDFQQKLYFSVGSLTGDYAEFQNAVLVFDTINGAWSLRDNIQATVFSKFIDPSTGRENIYFGTRDGKVYVFDDSLTASGSPIHMRVRTKRYFEEIGTQIIAERIGVYTDDGAGMVVSYRNSPTEEFRPAGTITRSPIQWFPLDHAVGPFFQMEFQHSETRNRPTILGYTIVWKPEGEVVHHAGTV